MRGWCCRCAGRMLCRSQSSAGTLGGNQGLTAARSPSTSLHKSPPGVSVLFGLLGFSSIRKLPVGIFLGF